jgi:hypothetical protein
MKGQLTADTPVAAPAAAVWEVYNGLKLGKVVSELCADTFGTVETLEGDGGVGTIVKLTFPPGTPDEPNYLTEKFIKIDHENRIKETEFIEGGYNKIGLDFCGARLEILEGDSSKSCIVRSSMVYEGDDELSSVVSMFSTEPLEVLAKTVDKYLNSKTGTSSS